MRIPRNITHDDLAPERVIVSKDGHAAFEATTMHRLFNPVHVGDKPDGTPVFQRGELLGIGVKMDSGHELYAQPNQIAPA